MTCIFARNFSPCTLAVIVKFVPVQSHKSEYDTYNGIQCETFIMEVLLSHYISGSFYNFLWLKSSISLSELICHCKQQDSYQTDRTNQGSELGSSNSQIIALYPRWAFVFQEGFKNKPSVSGPLKWNLDYSIMDTVVQNILGKVSKIPKVLKITKLFFIE